MATPPEQQSSGPLRNAEHDRSLHEVTAAVVAIAHPVPSVLRVTARLERSGDDPHWALPNVAFRIHLDGPAYGGASRIYTVRSFDAQAATFTFDIVRHAHASPMMRWGSNLRAGDVFRLTGPRPQFVVPAGAEKKIALFLDETGIPALYAMLQQWPAGAAGIGWVVTDDAAAFEELPTVPGLALQRLGTAHVAPDGPLATQARALPEPHDYVIWGAGERDEMRAIRQYLRMDAGLAKEQVLVAGYWKRGVSNTDIDLRRRQSFEQLIANGGTLADFDDLAVEV
ncbi:siderophore-interacting protein [Janthinobacterium violaceinigrum]|uniref:Siderophore-interacting protein n=1 Tax=Janthinobacterium violaceinigrum TaxID=2654252 RepID=A0A6I1HVL1_9BURK|nr:siderophore-interacting protein [Janthinobacterium violaceinigrum]KAB8061109.1 siderophore-interacting protein [Janthinobacterium violaceinigrum]